MGRGARTLPGTSRWAGTPSTGGWTSADSRPIEWAGGCASSFRRWMPGCGPVAGGRPGRSRRRCWGGNPGRRGIADEEERGAGGSAPDWAQSSWPAARPTSPRSPTPSCASWSCWRIGAASACPRPEGAACRPARELARRDAPRAPAASRGAVCGRRTAARPPASGQGLEHVVRPAGARCPAGAAAGTWRKLAAVVTLPRCSPLSTW
jgi:hypothetical protein